MLHAKKRPINRNVDTKNFELLETANKYSQFIYNNGENDYLVLSTTYHNLAHNIYYMLCRMYGGNNIKFKSPLNLQYNYDLAQYRQNDGSYRFPRRNTFLRNHIANTDIDMLQVLDLLDKLSKVDNRYVMYYDDSTDDYVIECRY